MYQPVQVRAGDLAAGEVVIENWNDFLSLDQWLTGQWQVVAEGKVLQSGSLQDLTIAPREHRKVKLPIQPVAAQPGVEYFLELSFRLKETKPWAKAGHEIAWEQIPMQVTAPMAAAKADKLPALQVTKTDKAITVTGKGFSASFDAVSGLLMSLKNGSKEMLDAALHPHFWRAPTDNDRGNKMPKELSVWRKAHETWKASKVTVVSPAPGRVSIVAEGEIGAVSSPYKLAWTVLGSGDVLVTAEFKPEGKLPELPRFGMQTTLRPGYDQLRWYGKGPQETYWDRQDARVGIYHGSVGEQFFPYVMPQETGNHESVRWIALTDKQGMGLMAIAQPLLSANALHFTTEDLFSGDHKANYYPYQLPVRDTVTLNLDMHQRGLGGDDSWGALPHKSFRLMPEPMSYSYRLKLLKGGEDLSALGRIHPGIDKAALTTREASAPHNPIWNGSTSASGAPHLRLDAYRSYPNEHRPRPQRHDAPALHKQ